LDPVLAEHIQSVSSAVNSLTDSGDFKSIEVLVSFFKDLASTFDVSSAQTLLESLEYINDGLIALGTSMKVPTFSKT